jgi:hypothetical protein
MMTVRERWLAALQLLPVDRLPFWPKIDESYLKAQAAPYNTMTPEKFHAWLGSDLHLWTPPLVHEMRAKTRLETETKGIYHKIAYRTPIGTIAGVQQYDAATGAWTPTIYPIRTHDGLAVMRAFYADALPKLDRTVFEKSKEFCVLVGNRACVGTVVGTSPFMELVQVLAGAEKTDELLDAYNEDVVALLEQMHQNMLKKMEYACKQSPADVLYLLENPAAVPITPFNFRAYCLPYLREYAEMAKKHGRLFVLQLGGRLKALLPELGTLPVTGIEGFTTPPDGDATLVDGRAACPHACFLGGTNASIWAGSPLEIIVHLDEQFEELPHLRGLVVTSGGLLPHSVDPKKLREICAWVQGYRMMK